MRCLYQSGRVQRRLSRLVVLGPSTLAPSGGMVLLGSILLSLSSSNVGAQLPGIMEGSLLAGGYCKRIKGQENILPPGGFPQSQNRRLPAIPRSLLFSGEEGCCGAGNELPGGAYVALLHRHTWFQL